MMISVNYTHARGHSHDFGRVSWLDHEGAEYSLMLRPGLLPHQRSMIAALRPDGVDFIRWCNAVQNAATRGASGETGHIYVEVTT